MEGPSAATKRGAKAVSRRGPQPTLEESRPLVSSGSNHAGGNSTGIVGGGGGGKANLPSPPRSGQFLIQSFPSIDKDDHHKRRYRVSLPYRMLFVLAMVFLMIPLLIFFYKETHIHRQHDHYKPERFINVNTKDVLNQLSDHANGTGQPPLTEVEDSLDEAETSVEEKKQELVEKEQEPVEKKKESVEKKKESVESETESTPQPQVSSTETKEETTTEQHAETTVDQIKGEDQVENEPEKDQKAKGENEPNATSGQTADGETVQTEAPVGGNETKQRIRRRL